MTEKLRNILSNPHLHQTHKNLRIILARMVSQLDACEGQKVSQCRPAIEAASAGTGRIEAASVRDNVIASGPSASDLAYTKSLCWRNTKLPPPPSLSFLSLVWGFFWLISSKEFPWLFRRFLWVFPKFLWVRPWEKFLVNLVFFLGEPEKARNGRTGLLVSSFDPRAQRPENAKGGGAKKRGRGGSPTETFCPPPPASHISLIKSLTDPQNFPQVTSSEPFSEGLQKWFPRGHPHEVLLFGTFCPPPL